MCILGIVGRPGVSWGVLGCPGVIRLTAHLKFIKGVIPIAQLSKYQNHTF